jgi:acetylornithine deacetylase/succinyl-diaminopimelate desuccinylase-like protein
MSETSVELLQALIRNACVNDGTPDSGYESRSVETLREFFGRPGEVRSTIEGRGSVVYRVPGTDPNAPSLMLMGHTDVVPANPAGWEVDPFAAEIIDGRVWGRGAVDMLNLTATMASVFSRYLDGSLDPLPGDLIYLGVADEEGGGRYGAQFLVDEHWDLVACDYLMTEIGQPRVVTPTGAYYPISTAEKGPMWRKLYSKGVPGHGSQPYGRDNAVIDMAQAITRLATTPSPVLISDEWRAVVETGVFGELREMMLDEDQIDAAIEILAATDVGLARWVHALTHMTFSPNIVHGGVKSNVVPESTEADVDVRVLPGHDSSFAQGSRRPLRSD